MSANCGRSLPASKILPEIVHFLAQLFVLLFEFLIHEDNFAFIRAFILISGDVKRTISAPSEIIAQA